MSYSFLPSTLSNSISDNAAQLTTMHANLAADIHRALDEDSSSSVFGEEITAECGASMCDFMEWSLTDDCGSTLSGEDSPPSDACADMMLKLMGCREMTDGEELDFNACDAPENEGDEAVFEGEGDEVIFLEPAWEGTVWVCKKNDPDFNGVDTIYYGSCIDVDRSGDTCSADNCEIDPWSPYSTNKVVGCTDRNFGAQTAAQIVYCTDVPYDDEFFYVDHVDVTLDEEGNSSCDDTQFLEENQGGCFGFGDRRLSGEEDGGDDDQDFYEMFGADSMAGACRDSCFLETMEIISSLYDTCGGSMPTMGGDPYGDSNGDSYGEDSGEGGDDDELSAFDFFCMENDDGANCMDIIMQMEDEADEGGPEGDLCWNLPACEEMRAAGCCLTSVLALDGDAPYCLYERMNECGIDLTQRCDAFVGDSVEVISAHVEVAWQIETGSVEPVKAAIAGGCGTDASNVIITSLSQTTTDVADAGGERRQLTTSTVVSYQINLVGEQEMESSSAISAALTTGEFAGAMAASLGYEASQVVLPEADEITTTTTIPDPEKSLDDLAEEAAAREGDSDDGFDFWSNIPAVSGVAVGAFAVVCGVAGLVFYRAYGKKNDGATDAKVTVQNPVANMA